LRPAAKIANSLGASKRGGQSSGTGGDSSQGHDGAEEEGRAQGRQGQQLIRLSALPPP
jgi:hypothetical protein